MKKDTQCDQLRQEVARCHHLLDEAGVPELLDEPERLFHRVSRLAAEHTLGASELSNIMRKLKKMTDEMEGDSDSTRQD